MKNKNKNTKNDNTADAVITRDEANRLFVALNFGSAPKWSPEKMGTMLTRLRKHIDEADEVAPEGKTIFDVVNTAWKAGRNVVLEQVDSAIASDPEPAPEPADDDAKPAKKVKKAKRAAEPAESDDAESDDAESDDAESDDAKPAKKVKKAKPAKPAKAAKAKAAVVTDAMLAKLTKGLTEDWSKQAKVVERAKLDSAIYWGVYTAALKTLVERGVAEMQHMPGSKLDWRAASAKPTKKAKAKK
jgi:hypothetical protein